MSEFDIEDLMNSPVLESEGVWCDFGKGRELKIARWQNPAFSSALRERSKKLQGVLKHQDEAAEKATLEMTKVLIAKTILKDCKGWKYKDGTLVTQYTEEFGLALAEDRNIRERIVTFATEENAYLQSVEDEALKK